MRADDAWGPSILMGPSEVVVLHPEGASDLSLTKDSQIGANLRVCADEEDRADFDRRN